MGFPNLAAHPLLKLRGRLRFHAAVIAPAVPFAAPQQFGLRPRAANISRMLL